MPELGWYMRRAAAMSPQEILVRSRLHFKKSRWRRAAATGWTPGANRSVWDPQAFWPVPLDIGEAGRRELLREAESYLEHRWQFFGLNGKQEKDIDWHRDPSTGIIAPSATFGLDINHRDESVVGNIKMTWEKSRHHHLTVLAAAYHQTRDERFAREVTDQIADWIDHNPFLLGVHWTHSLELGIRLIAWVWCERLLRGSSAYADLFEHNPSFWDSVYQHQWFISQTYSCGSSANNHLIGEMAGLYITASAWPQFEASGQWRNLAKSMLESEIQRQTFSSGLNREQAFSYHIFTLEFFLLCMAESKQQKDTFSETFMDRLQAMLKVMPQVTDCGGNLPMYGDGDEGRAVQFHAFEARRDGWLLDWGRDLVPFDQVGDVVPESVGTTFFDDAGLCVIRSATRCNKEIFLMSDVGPHGFLSLAAHAHADALSFVLSVDGLPMLVDPGTYAYHTDEHWRGYFRSTRAHNAVMVDGLEQSKAGGTFLWTRQAETHVHAWEPSENGARVDASHNGFAAVGVECRRCLSLTRQTLTVEDQLMGSGCHDIEIRFHTHPDCQVEVTNENRIKIKRKEIILDLTPPTNLSIRLARGELSAGWYSPRFGIKQEATTVILSQASAPLTTFTTRIEINP